MLCVQVGVSIQMSSFNLTRIVTMSPFYTLVNKSSYELEVGEVTNQSSTKWHYISSTEVMTLLSSDNRQSPPSADTAGDFVYMSISHRWYQQTFVKSRSELLLELFSYETDVINSKWC